MWRRIAADVRAVGERFGGDGPLGRRRTLIAGAPAAIAAPARAAAHGQPITIACSEKGWLRAVPEHLVDAAAVRYKEGDAARFVLHALTTDRLLLLGGNGRFYTFACDRLPAGRGFGEPLRLLVDLPHPFEPAQLAVHRPGGRLVVASDRGRGFVVEETDALGQTRSGKLVLVLGEGERAACFGAISEADDIVAVVGSNRRLLVFALAELPVMPRGRGVLLQKYREGGLADVRSFVLAGGLSWRSGQRVRVETDLRSWLGKRGQSGHTVPRGFPASGRFEA